MAGQWRKKIKATAYAYWPYNEAEKQYVVKVSKILAIWDLKRFTFFFTEKKYCKN